MKQRIGFLGCGNMGGAILQGMLRSKKFSSDQIIVCEVDRKKASLLRKKFKVKIVSTNTELIETCQTVILAIKPQSLTVLQIDVPKKILEKRCFISILAGATISNISQVTHSNRVIRVMPNLGSLYEEGMTALSPSSKSLSKDLKLAEKIFKASGEIVILRESFFDLITAISGSGPAYFFYLAELLAKEGKKSGLNQKTAQLLATQTALGAAMALKKSSHDPESLKNMVTSKKGTTEAALKAFKKAGFDQAVSKGVKAAVKRSQELREGK